MEDLFLDQIEDLYDAEKRLVKALPKMAEASTSPELRTAFQKHLRETENHVQRLERVFHSVGKDAKGKTCDAMKGLISEGEDVVDDIEESMLRDAGLIAAANRVEHYEMAAYGSARTFAEALGNQTAATELEATLKEEKNADEVLTRIATTSVNQQALHVSMS
jgi:ferritin-like metal-binding protein YciE